MLISEVLYYEHIWVWPTVRCVLILCSVSCLVAVARLEGSFKHATERKSSS